MNLAATTPGLIVLTAPASLASSSMHYWGWKEPRRNVCFLSQHPYRYRATVGDEGITAKAPPLTSVTPTGRSPLGLHKPCVLGGDDLGMLMLLLHECRTVMWRDENVSRSM
jgi:hypothetical protein